MNCLAITLGTIIFLCIVTLSDADLACYLAKTCIHNAKEKCGVDGENYRRFLDTCDLLEYNCLKKTDFKKTAMSDCDEHEKLEISADKPSTEETADEETAEGGSAEQEPDEEETIQEDTEEDSAEDEEGLRKGHVKIKTLRKKQIKGKVIKNTAQGNKTKVKMLRVLARTRTATAKEEMISKTTSRADKKNHNIRNHKISEEKIHQGKMRSNISPSTRPLKEKLYKGKPTEKAVIEQASSKLPR